MRPPLQKLIEHTVIIHKETNFRRLQIAEAVPIMCQRPSINIQQAAEFILPSSHPLEPHHHQEEPAIQRDFNELQGRANHSQGPTTRAAARVTCQLSANQNRVSLPSHSHRARHPL